MPSLDSPEILHPAVHLGPQDDLTRMKAKSTGDARYRFFFFSAYTDGR